MRRDMMGAMSRMLEEIRQHPEALALTLRSELRGVERLRRLFEKTRPRLVVLVARGTSDNAALFGRYLLEITTGIPVSLAAPSISTLYRARVDYRGALVVAISQSGVSTDTNVVLVPVMTSWLKPINLSIWASTAMSGTLPPP